MEEAEPFQLMIGESVERHYSICITLKGASDAGVRRESSLIKHCQMISLFTRRRETARELQAVSAIPHGIADLSSICINRRNILSKDLSLHELFIKGSDRVFF